MKLFALAALALIIFLYWYYRSHPEAFKAPGWQISAKNQFLLVLFFGGAIVGYFAFCLCMAFSSSDTTIVIFLVLFILVTRKWIRDLRTFKRAYDLEHGLDRRPFIFGKKFAVITAIVAGITVVMGVTWRSRASVQFQSIFDAPIPACVTSSSCRHGGPYWCFAFRGDAACIKTLENLAVAPQRADMLVSAGDSNDRVAGDVLEDPYWQQLMGSGKPVYRGNYHKESSRYFFEIFTDRETAAWIVVRSW